ncbi:MAG: carbohydrate ABC transporter permease [Clostridiaceae bacterium]|jgi:putative aldouronate transport system permease protein|nr:carbohydrate ABC transporter permease [Clostridiaceae bacterium]
MYFKFRNKRYKLGDVIFNTVNVILLLFLCVVTLYPFLNTLAVSFNEGLDSVRGGIFLLPRKFTLQNYRSVFISGTIPMAFIISVLRTVITVILNVFLTAMMAYCLSRKEYIFNKFITIAVVLTMYFNAGLIPGFLLIKNLGLYGSFWVYVIPTLISAFNVIVVRTYIGSIPESLVESARLDGAGDFRIFLRIIFPLCKPALAVIAMFVAIWQWNNWFDTYLYTSSKQHLSTLSFELQKLLASSFSQGQSAQAATSGIGAELAGGMVTPIAMQAAITIVAMVPIIMVYPFVQRYFVTGLNVGGVKE